MMSVHLVFEKECVTRVKSCECLDSTASLEEQTAFHYSFYLAFLREHYIYICISFLYVYFNII